MLTQLGKYCTLRYVRMPVPYRYVRMRTVFRLSFFFLFFPFVYPCTRRVPVYEVPGAHKEPCLCTRYP